MSSWNLRFSSNFCRMFVASTIFTSVSLACTTGVKPGVSSSSSLFCCSVIVLLFSASVMWHFSASGCRMCASASSAMRFAGSSSSVICSSSGNTSSSSTISSSSPFSFSSLRLLITLYLPSTTRDSVRTTSSYIDRELISQS